MKVCGKKDIHVPECSDCSELEERVEAVEECCDDAHDEIDTLTTDKADKDYVDDSIDNVNQTIANVADTLGERIDNIITASEPSVTTLWEGVMDSIGDSANLSEDVNDFDYLDIYYRTSVDESEGYYNTVRIPADQFANYIITVGGTLSPLGESPNIKQYLTQLSFVDDTATIDNIREWSWNGSQSSDASDDMQAESGVTIYRIDGIKEAGGNAEIVDARIGVDGTVYPSLGDAIREQIQDTRDMIPQLVKTVNGNPIVLDDAWGEVKNLDVELLPIQDLHGYSKPWAAGAGKNKFDEDTIYATYQQTDGSFLGAAGIINLIQTPIPQSLVGQQLTFSAKIKIPTGSTLTTPRVAATVGGVDKDGNAVTSSDYTLSSVTFTPTSTSDKVRITFGSNSGQNTQFKDVQLELGSTATTYEPYSNICPITGHDSVSVTDTGVNQWDEEWENGTLDAQGNPAPYTNYFRTKNYINVSPNTAYYFKSNDTLFACNYDANKTIIGAGYYIAANSIKTMPQNCYYLKFVDIVRNTYQNDISVNLPSTDTAYHAYHGQSKTVTLPHTVYGAGVGVTSGESKETWFIKEPPYTISSYGTSGQGIPYVDILIGGIVANNAESISSSYEQIHLSTTGASGKYKVYGGPTLPNCVFTIYDDRFTDATQAKALLDSENVQIAVKLTTPLDLQTTPTSLTLYNGDNVVSSDGDMELSYVQDMAIVIRKIENQL